MADDDTDAAELFAAGGGGARSVADDNAEGPVARGGDAARSLADDSAEEPVAGGRCEACGRCCRCRAPVTHVSSLLPGTKGCAILIMGMLVMESSGCFKRFEKTSQAMKTPVIFA